MKRIICFLKRNFWYIIAALGFAAVFFSVTSSDGGAELQYTVPPAIIGCVMAYIGILQGNQIAEHRREAARIAARRHGMKLLKQQEDKHNESIM